MTIREPGEGWPEGTDLLLDRPWSNAVYWFVLAAAAAVDIVNFQGVVAIVMRESTEFLTWTVVGGFTVLALALSHQVGVLAHDRIEHERHPLSSGLGWLVFAGWLAMGLFAFAVRYDDPRRASVLEQLGDSGPRVLPASMFLTFYLATGLIAGLAGYRRPSADTQRLRRVAGLRLRLGIELAEAEGRIAEVTSRLAAIDRRRQRREEELRLELARHGVERLAAVRDYHADLAQLDDQELGLRDELARLDRTIRQVTDRLHEFTRRSRPGSDSPS